MDPNTRPNSSPTHQKPGTPAPAASYGQVMHQPARQLPVPSDGPALTAIRRGDARGWPALIAAHGPNLYGLCCKLDADPDDAYQEIWEKLCAKLDHFDDQQGSFASWSRTVARRHLIDRHRRQRARGEVSARFDALVDDVPEVAQRLDAHRQHHRLTAAVARLPPGQRRAVVLHHIEGLPLETIAAHEDTAVGTIKSRLHRARARLALMLKGAP